MASRSERSVLRSWGYAMFPMGAAMLCAAYWTCDRHPAEVIIEAIVLGVMALGIGAMIVRGVNRANERDSPGCPSSGYAVTTPPPVGTVIRCAAGEHRRQPGDAITERSEAS